MEKKYKIKYLPKARQDLKEINDYIKIDDSKAALKLIDQIDSSISQLSDFPALGKVPKDQRLGMLNYRVLVVHNYLVFYVVKKDFIQVRRVIHGRRKFDSII